MGELPWKIALIGYRATGKTTLAERLAQRMTEHCQETKRTQTAEPNHESARKRESKPCQLAGPKREAWTFFDSDQVIVHESGKTITQIFADEGEPAFREREVQVIRSLLVRPERLVLATGGGVPLREESRKILRERAVVVWLQAAPETIFRRMNADMLTQAQRPSLTGLTMIQEIVQLVQEREPFYRQTAHVALATDDASPEFLAEAIVNFWDEFRSKYREP